MTRTQELIRDLVIELDSVIEEFKQSGRHSIGDYEIYRTVNDRNSVLLPGISIRNKKEGWQLVYDIKLNGKI